MAIAGNDNLLERLHDPKDHPVCAGPLAGWTDAPYRKILRECGVKHLWIPFVSSHAIDSQGPNRDAYVQDVENEHEHVQIFGSNPEINARAAAVLERKGARSIDFNAGCSVKKVHKGGGGSALLKDIDLLISNLKAVKDAVGIPVSLKTRIGFYSGDRSGIEACKRAQDLGCAWVTLHGRYAKQALGGNADWEEIEKLSDELSIPVIGNGDIFEPGDARRMLTETGCAGVMIGRAIMGDPWIISDTERYLEDRSPRPRRTRSEMVEVILAHQQAVLEHHGPEKGTREFRKHLAKYLRGFAQAAKLRSVLVRLDDPGEVTRMLKEFGAGRPPGRIQ